MIGAILLLTMLSGTPGQDIEYTRELMKKKKADMGDLSFVFYSLLGKEKPAEKASEAAAALVKKGWMPSKWSKDLEAKITLGDVCYLMCHTLEIKGGMMMRVFGYTRRYCYRECVQRRLVRGNGPHSRVSGRDLLGVYTLLENRLEEKEEKAAEDSP